jgi:maltose O-acetyltransferase
MINFIFRIKDSISRKLNNFIWKLRLKKIGKNTIIDTNVKIYNPLDIEIGNNCTINTGVILQSCEGAKIKIGNNVTLSYNSLLITGGLDLSDTSETNTHISKDIIIKDNVWIGADVKVLPGVKIEENSIIAAGSVVTKDVSKNLIVGGVPVKTIKERNL